MKFIDPDISRKNEIVNKNANQQALGSQPPIFSILEINLCGLCTRRCVFCPHSQPDYQRANEYMPLELFKKVMIDLQKVNYEGTVIFSAFCEPLLHQQVELFIELARSACPNAMVELITNGDLLTQEKLAGLFKAGLTTLCISMYDGPHQLKKFKTLQETVGLKEGQIVFRPRWLSADKQYGITLTNRGGAIEIKDAGVTTPDAPLKRPCFYPFYQTLIDYDGSVILCTHDWNKKLVAGNVNESSILEIWNNDILRGIRKNLAKSKRDFTPCNLCSAEGLFMGRSHYERWQEYYGQQ